MNTSGPAAFVIAAVLLGSTPGVWGQRVPSPDEIWLPALAEKSPLAEYSVRMAQNGGFEILVGPERFAVETRFSFPNGGENRLTVGESGEGESGWKPQNRKTGPSGYAVFAKGRYYSLDREIRVLPNRISVRDTLRNLHGEALGILFGNTIDLRDRGIRETFLGGHPKSGPADIKINPTVFAAKAGLGFGLIALDDVYWVQAQGYAGADAVEILSNEFAVDTGAAYTIEWAIYVNSTGDYYDFINAVRRDENRNRVTVDGGFFFAFRPPADGEAPRSHAYRRLVPTKEDLDIRGAKFVSAPCLAHAADDPRVSVEGIEFMDFPQEMELIRKQADAVYAVDPGVKFMFHIAHALYATDRPRELFPDSLVTDAGGRQHVYGSTDSYYYNGAYFSKERLDDGWRWWIFYPSLQNSMGRRLLESVEIMADRLGCKGAFMDGFMGTYGDAYTYSAWDGHSADIDPRTKTIARKKGSVLILSQECLAAYVHKWNSRGGTVVANYPVMTRTIAKEDMVCDQECRIGPDTHLMHTPITLSPLGAKAGVKTEQDVYHDILAALATGNLYFYYGEPRLTGKSLPEQMYPITIQDIRSGCVTGQERIVTMRSGRYGWRDDNGIHFVHLYDQTGKAAPHSFFSTVDGAGTRTAVDLKERESAVVKKIPVVCEASKAVNILCEKYDASGLSLLLNGSGTARLVIRDGGFAVEPGARYAVSIGDAVKTISAGETGLIIDVELRGETAVKIGG